MNECLINLNENIDNSKCHTAHFNLNEKKAIKNDIS